MAGLTHRRGPGVGMLWIGICPDNLDQKGQEKLMS